MKICKNCRHYGRGIFSNACIRREGNALNPVTGEFGTKRYRDADDERKPHRWFSSRKKCGPEAIYFKEKLSPDVGR